jgi:hypothetical protein
MPSKWLVRSKKKKEDAIVRSVDVIDRNMPLAEAGSTRELVGMPSSWHIEGCRYIRRDAFVASKFECLRNQGYAVEARPQGNGVINAVE